MAKFNLLLPLSLTIILGSCTSGSNSGNKASFVFTAKGGKSLATTNAAVKVAVNTPVTPTTGGAYQGSSPGPAPTPGRATTPTALPTCPTTTTCQSYDYIAWAGSLDPNFNLVSCNSQTDCTKVFDNAICVDAPGGYLTDNRGVCGEVLTNNTGWKGFKVYTLGGPKDSYYNFPDYASVPSPTTSCQRNSPIEFKSGPFPAGITSIAQVPQTAGILVGQKGANCYHNNDQNECDSAICLKVPGRKDTDAGMCSFKCVEESGCQSPALVTDWSFKTCAVAKLSESQTASNYARFCTIDFKTYSKETTDNFVVPSDCGPDGKLARNVNGMYISNFVWNFTAIKLPLFLTKPPLVNKGVAEKMTSLAQ